MKSEGLNMRCFAYGSNMHRSQMIERCPNSKFYSKAILESWELVFNKFSQNRGCHAANIRPQEGKSVWGVLFDMSESDWSNLDKMEGKSYKRTPIKVLVDGVFLDCATYIADADKAPGKPSKDYIGRIIEGAIESDLPTEYVSYLESVICL